jgi:large subunit ribosomal protein L13
MLPHNRLGRAMIKKLKVYASDSHPHQAQVKAMADEDRKKGEAS